MINYKGNLEDKSVEEICDIVKKATGWNYQDIIKKTKDERTILIYLIEDLIDELNTTIEEKKDMEEQYEEELYYARKR